MFHEYRGRLVMNWSFDVVEFYMKVGLGAYLIHYLRLLLIYSQRILIILYSTKEY